MNVKNCANWGSENIYPVPSYCFVVSTGDNNIKENKYYMYNSIKDLLKYFNLKGVQ